MSYGAKETPHISAPPSHPVRWAVWAKGDPPHAARKVIVVYAQMWAAARAEGCRRLGVPECDGERVRDDGEAS